MVDIFLSYAHEDSDRIRQLANDLEAEGWSVYWDERIPGGADWRESIRHALQQTACVIVAWSRHSVASNWVIDEAEEAQKQRKLIPVMLDDVDLPMGLRSLQARSLTDMRPGHASKQFQQLTQDIHQILKTAPQKPPVESTRQSSKPRKRWLIAGIAGASLLVLTLLTVKNISVEPDRNQPTPVSSRQPAVSYVPPHPSGFLPMAGSMDETRWIYKQGNGGDRIMEGQLEVYTHRGDRLIWAENSETADNYRYTITTAVVSGPSILGFGLVFGFQNPDNYYWFAKRTDRDYKLIHKINGVENVLIPWTSSDRITDIRQNQELGIETEGNLLTLLVDGQALNRVKLDQFPQGQVGVYVGKPGLTVRYSNATLSKR